MSNLRAFAARYSSRGLPGSPDLGPVDVLPVRAKAPALPGSRGVLDAAREPAVVRDHFSRAGVTGIGVRVPPWAVVLDVDPRSGGDLTLGRLVAEHGPLPATLRAATGRGDGGVHIWWLRPPGRLSGRLVPGVDVKTSGGYVLVEPSLHPAGGLYRWERPAVRVAAMPGWLAALVVEPEHPVQSVPRWRGTERHPISTAGRRSVVEDVNAVTSWAEILPAHGWTLVRGDGDADGSLWRHPDATAPVSASIRGGRLYVFSTRTAFTPTEPGQPRGYSRAEALAVLDHDGDLRALVAEIVRTGSVSA